MMIDLNKLPSPITLDVLENIAPKAFAELARMDISHRSILLAWLNGQSTSPIGRGYADVEIDKEDAKHSHLKIKCLIEYRSKRELGRKVSHLMTEQQRFNFLNNREAQREKVQMKVKRERKVRAKKSLIRVLEILGVEEAQTIIVTEQLKQKDAANDPAF